MFFVASGQPIHDWLDLGDLGATAILTFFVWYALTRTIPSMLASHDKQVAEITRSFREEIREERKSHEEEVRAIREELSHHAKDVTGVLLALNENVGHLTGLTASLLRFLDAQEILGRRPASPK
jgi:hypothetical protein